MSDQSYVRTEMLPEQPAPFGETGILRWVKAKFFSNVLNSITTLVMVYILYWMIAEFLHWAWQPSWGMSSRRECFDAASVTGACWGVIPERFNQLMFGFILALNNGVHWRLAFFCLLRLRRCFLVICLARCLLFR